MAKVFPFQPYRYAAPAGDINHLVTQPYDKISPDMRSRYLALSPYNLVRVILGERLPDDSEESNVYTRARGYFKEWMDRGLLGKEREPAFYPYFQQFTLPDTGERLVRKGFIGLGAVEDYSAGVVHRHEQTLSGPKKDRLQVLTHTRAHFGQIFMLYPDSAGAVDTILDEAASGEPIMQVNDEYGAVHTVWRITGDQRLSAIRSLMADKKLVIADGHHRYETALNFRDQNPGLVDAGRVMMTFVNMYSLGLRILATHRLVCGLDTFSAPDLLAKAARCFSVSKLDGLDALRHSWSAPHAGRMRIGLAIAGDPGIYLLECEKKPGMLDVPTLHELLIESALGITSEAVRQEKFIRYMRGTGAALDQVRQANAQAAFLLEPTSIDDVASVSFSGGVMPQKSTDFYPKLLSGLTIYRIEK
jgi:uncharacterized protein (DUF1015 family)